MYSVFWNQSVFKHNSTWKWVPAYPYLTEQLTYPCCKFAYVFSFTVCNLFGAEARYFDDFKLYCVQVNNCHAGHSNILLDECTIWLLMSYRLIIWSYQVDISEFHDFITAIFLGGGCPYVFLFFQLLTCIARLKRNLCLCYKAFYVAHLSGSICKSDPTGMVKV